MKSQEFQFLIDTGASVTILSSKAYRSIPNHCRPLLSNRAPVLEGVDGSILKVEGSCEVTLELSADVWAQVVVTIADIPDDGILGMDAIKELGCSIDTKNEILWCARTKTEFICRVSTIMPKCCRVLVADADLVVPAEHEVVVTGKQILGDGDEGRVKWSIVEPLHNEDIHEKILMGRTLVDSSKEFCPVRMVNYGDEDVVIVKGTLLGILDPVVSCTHVMDSETKDQDSEESIRVSIVKEKEVEPENIEDLPSHVKTLYEDCVSGLSPDERAMLKRCLQDYEMVFAKSDTDLGRTNLVKHDIDVGEARPIRLPPRRLPKDKQREAERQVEKLLKNGLIELSTSPWAAAVTMAKKRDGSYRLCCDYRGLNGLSKKKMSAWPIRSTDETLFQLEGAKFFCTMDAMCGFWQMELTDRAILLSSFRLNNALYQWKAMPFGLCGVPASFQMLMDKVLANLQPTEAMVYIDDIITYGKTATETIGRLRNVLQRLKDANIKLKPSKCHLMQRSVRFLGHVVSEDGVACDPEKTRAVREWPTCKYIHELRAFIGTVSYYKKFIQGFSDICRPLYKLMEKGQKFEWSEECTKSMEKLKEVMVEPPILAYPREEGQWLLDTDASSFAVGAVLSQIQDDEERVIAYGSRTLNKSEKNYCTTRRELLAVVHFTRYFKHYLYGVDFTIRTDHGAGRTGCPLVRNFGDILIHNNLQERSTSFKL
jgi:predicted aspartyl protease